MREGIAFLTFTDRGEALAEKLAGAGRKRPSGKSAPLYMSALSGSPCAPLRRT